MKLVGFLALWLAIVWISTGTLHTKKWNVRIFGVGMTILLLMAASTYWRQ